VAKKSKNTAHLAEHPQHGVESDQPYNIGTLVSGSMAPLSGDGTVVIAGIPRGGTTMVAECLATLGLPIGAPVPPQVGQFNMEDREFVKFLHMEQPGPIDMNGLRALIRSRNQEHSVWGFKLPMALNSLPVLQEELRNPRFILVFRDVVAVSIREAIAMKSDAFYAMRRALRWQERMIDFAEDSPVACQLVSYEKALQFPELFLDAMVKWCGMSVPEERRLLALSTIAANNSRYLLAVSRQRQRHESTV
jgi:hypothetical protein